jgi:hypothetical protein
MTTKKPVKTTAAPETEQAQQEHNKTKVTVKQTRVKYFDAKENEIKSVVLTGKLTMGQCKEYAKLQGSENVVVMKEPLSETFLVDTVALVQLREPE